MGRPPESPRVEIFVCSDDAPAAGRSTARPVSGKLMLSHILASCGCRVGRFRGLPPSASINPVDEGHLKRRFVRAAKNMMYRLRSTEEIGRASRRDREGRKGEITGGAAS